MSFNSFIPRGGLYKPHETSRLHSPREPGSPTHLWKHLEKTTQRTDSQTQVLAQLRAEVDILKRQRPALSGMHPFKVYNFPRNLRKFRNADDWRRAKVRGGRVVLDGVRFSSDGSGAGDTLYAYGSDGAIPSFVRTNDDLFTTEPNIALQFQRPPTSSASVVIDGSSVGGRSWNEAVVPNDGNEYFLWFSFTIPEDPSLTGRIPWGVCFGKASDTPFSPTVPTTSLSSGFQFDDVWRTFPDRDPYHIPIARLVVSGDHLSIYQLLNDEPLNRNVYADRGDLSELSDSISITPRFRGPYNDDAYYFVGDLVTIIEDSIVGGGMGFLSQYIYIPTVYDGSGAGPYMPQNLLGPLNAVSPLTDSPDPWILMARSPYQATPALDWQTGAYDASKAYLRST